MKKQNTSGYMAPWEKAFDRVLTPLEEFIHRQTTSAILLMACAVAALIVANSPWMHSYHSFLATYFTIGTEDFQVSLSLHHWINDGLMAIFFFVVGLELKREVLVGELAELKQAILPIVAAFGGMLVPVLIYMVINPASPAFDGWGVPMATDIAFALGVIALLGNRVPKNLLTFLVAVAIVDDLGAVFVIAVFYTDTIDLYALGFAIVTLLLLIGLNLGGIRRSLPYMLVGLVLWIATLKSGIHASLAGVFLAFTIPMRPKYDPVRFLEQMKELVERARVSYKLDSNIIRNDQLRAHVSALETGTRLVQAPAQMLEHAFHLPSAYLVIPIFALANAGIPIDWSSLGSTATDPVSMGIVAGLVIGKVLGIAGFAWVVVKLQFASLPAGLNFKHIIGAALLGGIGFTMSIFIAELAFASHPEDLLMAKTGILVASVLAGCSGYFWLYFTASQPVDE